MLHPNLTARLLGGALLALAALPAAQAHNFWLRPSTTVLSAPAWITVDAAVSNDLFYFNHVPLNLDNLTVSGPAGAPVAVENLHRGKLRQVFDLNLTDKGTYRLAVVNSGISASWKEGDKPKRWRGKAEEFAANVPADAAELKVAQQQSRLESFVTVGAPTAVTPGGSGLEMQPLTHPNDLVAGEPAVFRFLIDGQPAAGLAVTLVRGDTRYRNQLEEIKAVADAKGEISVSFPSAGLYWLDADAEDSKTSLPQAKIRRLGYVATLEVLPQ